MRLIEREAMSDPAFKALRKRWIKRFRHAGHRRSRMDCEWCMGHTITGTILRSRGDGAIVTLSFDGFDFSFNSRDRHFWDLVALHRRALRSESNAKF